MAIRALLFDVNGTLTDIETDDGMEEIYRGIGHYLSYQGIFMRRGQVRDLYFEIMKAQLANSREAFPEYDVVAVWRELLERAKTAYTCSLPWQKLAQMPLFLAEMQRGISRKRLRPFPGAIETLDRLRRSYALGVVSDAQTAWAVPELTAAGLHAYFNPVIVSGDYGYRKPDRRLFERALDHLEVCPNQAVFIGNDPYRDVFGAKQAGMKTILFCTGTSWNGSGEAVPDYVIHEFAELPQAVEFLGNG